MHQSILTTLERVAVIQELLFDQYNMGSVLTPLKHLGLVDLTTKSNFRMSEPSMFASSKTVKRSCDFLLSEGFSSLKHIVPCGRARK